MNRRRPNKPRRKRLAEKPTLGLRLRPPITEFSRELNELSEKLSATVAKAMQSGRYSNGSVMCSLLIASQAFLRTITAHVQIVNAFLAEEHDDNRRFLADCERWFNHPIITLRDEKYGASAREVWRRKRFMKGPFGAPCSMLLKRELIARFLEIGDRLVFGFTADETDRAYKFLSVGHLCPLIERNLNKPDCLAIIERAGIELPWNYRIGLNNGNCLGCPKGGEGYWNFIRIIAPEAFEATAQIQDEIGPGSFFFFNRNTGERFGLRQLDPEAGRHDRTVPDCSFFCAMAEEEM